MVSGYLDFLHGNHLAIGARQIPQGSGFLQRAKVELLDLFLGLISELEQHHFSHILLVKTDHRANPNSKKGKHARAAVLRDVVHQSLAR